VSRNLNEIQGGTRGSTNWSREVIIKSFCSFLLISLQSFTPACGLFAYSITYRIIKKKLITRGNLKLLLIDDGDWVCGVNWSNE
jgi:hypothetical protein